MYIHYTGQSKYTTVKVRKNLLTRRCDYNLFLFSKSIGAFYMWIEIIGGFLHVPKPINCLTYEYIFKYSVSYDTILHTAMYFEERSKYNDTLIARLQRVFNYVGLTTF
jgi:hypothetical protein